MTTRQHYLRFERTPSHMSRSVPSILFGHQCKRETCLSTIFCQCSVVVTRRLFRIGVARRYTTKMRLPSITRHTTHTIIQHLRTKFRRRVSIKTHPMFARRSSCINGFALLRTRNSSCFPESNCGDTMLVTGWITSTPYSEIPLFFRPVARASPTVGAENPDAIVSSVS